MSTPKFPANVLIDGVTEETLDRCIDTLQFIARSMADDKQLGQKHTLTAVIEALDFERTKSAGGEQ